MILYDKPIKIELENEKLVVNNVFHPPAARTAREMKDVLSGKFPLKDPKQQMYYMFRGVHTSGNLQYDITVIPQFMYGNEYAKTYGHYHPLAEGDLSYPEVYQVLSGNAAFILQKKNKDESINALVIKGTPGEILLIPPNYGHVSVNISEGPLVLGNAVSSKFKSEYDGYKKNKGAAVYYTQNGAIHNTNCLLRKIERKSPHDINRKYGFICEDLLTELYNSPKKFEFLDKPSLMFMPED